MPDALSLLNMDDAHHLECLAWAVYDGTLLVGGWTKLPGDHPWCMVLAGLYKHIYRGCDDVAHCPPHTLGSWDCQERIEALCRGAGSAPHKVARGEHPSPGGSPEAALYTAPRHQPRGIEMDTPTAHPPVCLRGLTVEQPHPPVCLQGATVEQPHPPTPTPCPNWPRQLTSHPMPGPATLVGEWPGPPSMMKMHEMMTSKPHTPVCRIIQREDDGCGELVDGRMEALRGSPGW